MNNTIETMHNKYDLKNNKDKENAIKEIMQEIVLAGLSRGGFFKKAAFYGGTCLRIFHGLNRFSEDLDFAVLDRNDPICLEDYFQSIIREFSSFGIEVKIEKKSSEFDHDIMSAFLEGNTLILMMSFFDKNNDYRDIVPNQKIKIKFEVDLNNPLGGSTEFRYKMFPSPYEIQIFDERTLFAGKIHAILCRNYKNRVKGRDFYDYLFYVGKGSGINLRYLENKLKNTGGLIDENEALTIERVKSLLREKFTSVDYKSAIRDVSPFVSDTYNLELWNKDLFLSTLDELKE